MQQLHRHIRKSRIASFERYHSDHCRKKYTSSLPCDTLRHATGHFLGQVHYTRIKRSV